MKQTTEELKNTRKDVERREREQRKVEQRTELHDTSEEEKCEHRKDVRKKIWKVERKCKKVLLTLHFGFPFENLVCA